MVRHLEFLGLRRCFDCYRVERTSSLAGLTPAVDHRLFATPPGYLVFSMSLFRR